MKNGEMQDKFEKSSEIARLVNEIFQKFDN